MRLENGYIYQWKNKNYEWIKEEDGQLVYGNGANEYEWECDIIKHSPNIKDLIKAGDFITYKYMNTYWLIPTSVYAKSKDNKTTLMVDDYTLNEIEILSIVTKEQFESMEYKINE